MRSWNKFSLGLHPDEKWRGKGQKPVVCLRYWAQASPPRPRWGSRWPSCTAGHTQRAPGRAPGVRSPTWVRRAPDNQNHFEFEIGSEVSYLEEPANHADWNSSSYLITSNSQQRWGKPLIRPIVLSSMPSTLLGTIFVFSNDLHEVLLDGGGNTCLEDKSPEKLHIPYPVTKATKWKEWEKLTFNATII